MSLPCGAVPWKPLGQRHCTRPVPWAGRSIAVTERLILALQEKWHGDQGPHLRGPETPAEHAGAVHRPHMIRIAGGDCAVSWPQEALLGRGRGAGSVFWAVDTSCAPCWPRQTPPAPTGSSPDGSDPTLGFAGRCPRSAPRSPAASCSLAGGFLPAPSHPTFLESFEPAVHGRARHPESFLHPSLGDLIVLHQPENAEAFQQRIGPPVAAFPQLGSPARPTARSWKADRILQEQEVRASSAPTRLASARPQAAVRAEPAATGCPPWC